MIRPLHLPLLALFLASPLPAKVLVTLGGGSGVNQPGSPPPAMTSDGLPISAADLSNLRFTPLRVPCRDGRWAQINPPFLYMTDPEIEGRFLVMREMLIHAIREMRHNGRTAERISARISNTYNRNQIKLILGNECRQSTTETFEGSANPITDEVSLSMRLFFERGLGNCDVALSVSPPGFTDSRGIILYGTLLHEGLHLMQDFSVPATPASTLDARRVRKLQQNELEALALQKDALDQTAASLGVLRNTNRVSGTSHFARAVAREFLTAFIDPPTRNLMIDHTLNRLQVEQQRIDQVIDRRGEHLAIHQAYIDGDLGGIPFPANNNLNNAMRRVLLNNLSRDGITEPVIVSSKSGTFVDQGGGNWVVQQNNILRQRSTSGTVMDFPVSGVEFITDMRVALDGSHLLVTGSNTDGDGFLIGYQDTDDDGFFEEATRTQAIEDSALFLATLAQDFAAGELLAFSQDSKDILRLHTSGFALHPYPDFATSRGSIGFTREDVRRIWITENGLHAFGAPDCDSATHENTKWLRATTSGLGGDFVPDPPWCPSENHVFTPIFYNVPQSGFAFMQVRFFPGFTFCVFVHLAGEKFPIAKNIVATPGFNLVNFGQVLTPGYVVQIVGENIALDSVRQVVWDPVAPHLSPPAPDGSEFCIDLLGNPNDDYWLNGSTDLANWGLPITTLTTDGYGMEIYTAPYASFAPSQFFQAEEVP